MNVMVMDVEGTDGRERGEDQVSQNIQSSAHLSHICLGLRAEVGIVLTSFIRGPHCQLVGTPSRPLPRCKYGIIEDRV